MKTSLKHNGMALHCAIKNLAPMEITHKFEGIAEELINGEGRDFAEKVGYEMPFNDINRMIHSWIEGIVYVLEMFPSIDKEHTESLRAELDEHREAEFKRTKKKLKKAFPNTLEDKLKKGLQDLQEE